MWLSFNNAFLSIVSDPKSKDSLLVRARRPGDIESVFEGVKVTKTPGRDYLFRASIPRQTVADVVAQKVLDIDYGNFKDSVENDELHDAYSRVWSTMSRLQPIPPYQIRRRSTGDRYETDSID